MVRAGEHDADALGIERLAAQSAVADRLNGGRWQIVGEFVEMETGGPLMALFGHYSCTDECPLLGVKRT